MNHLNINLEFFNPDELLPANSCEVLVLSGAGHMTLVDYSAKHRRFNQYDDSSEDTSFAIVAWAYVDGVEDDLRTAFGKVPCDE